MIAAGGSVLVVWGNWGPYHYARLREFARHGELVGFRVAGLELYERSGVYEWTPEDTGIRMLRLGFPGAETQTRPLLMLTKVLPVLRRERPDVVFVPSYWPWSLMLNLMARAHGARIVMMNESHAATTRRGVFRDRMKRLVVSRFDAALVGGRKQMEFFAELGLDRDRVFTGYDAVDNEAYAGLAATVRASEQDYRESFELPNRFILSLGRLVPKKNLPVLLQGFAAMVKYRVTDTKLVIVGDGPERDSLLVECIRLGLTVSVRGTPGWRRDADVLFYPAQVLADVATFYSLASVFVLPSVLEEWGLVVNEAAACGLPLLVSSAAGCAPELCIDGENGFQFEPGDHADLARRLVQLDGDPVLCAALGKASRRVVSDWGVERFASGAILATERALQ